MKKAYFAGGCFWCIAAAFYELEGVTQVTDGYAGGTEDAPTYSQVKKQQTHHRETICVEYEEDKLSYPDLLDFFFDHVDPFDPDGQFIDRGFSYTLALFCQDEAETRAARDKIAEVEQKAGKKVCVSVLPFTNFFLAEEEHQNYAQKNEAAFAREYEESGRKAYFEGKKTDQ